MTTREDRMARAGDYVLGLMDDAARERAERDMMVDAEFRDCVALLAIRMRALDRSAGEDPVPEGMWSAIERRIAELPQMRGVLEENPSVASIPLTRPAKPVAPRSMAFGGWQGMALAASLLAALGVGYLGGTMLGARQDPVVVVILNDENEIPGAIVEAFANDEVRIVPLVDFPVPQGKTLEVWTLYDREVGPVSLGTFQRPQEIRLRGPDLPSPQPQQLYEITLEDAPGSPIGRPTGPILVKGLAVTPVR